MTQFKDLQAAHERLMEQSKAPEDVTGFVAEVQHEIHNMCVAAEDIPAPRERDQLRAILRFWASYVYDHTGTYPDTTLHPAIRKEADASAKAGGIDFSAGGDMGRDEVAAGGDVVGRTVLVSRHARPPLFWIALAAGAALIVLLAVVKIVPTLIGPASTSAKPPDATVNVEVTTVRPLPLLQVQWTIFTAGPSPFDPNVWAVKLQLSATGGDGNYIFWVNGTHLPDVSNNQFTVEGKGCEPQKPVVGVTSGGQATSLELVIQSPLTTCQQP